MEELGMEKTKYYKRVPTDTEGILSNDDNKIIKNVAAVASDISVGYANEMQTILEVKVCYDGIDNLKKGNAILGDAGFSPDLETMLQKA